MFLLSSARAFIVSRRPVVNFFPPLGLSLHGLKRNALLQFYYLYLGPSSTGFEHVLILSNMSSSSTDTTQITASCFLFLIHVLRTRHMPSSIGLLTLAFLAASCLTVQLIFEIKQFVSSKISFVPSITLHFRISFGSMERWSYLDKKFYEWLDIYCLNFKCSHRRRQTSDPFSSLLSITPFHDITPILHP